MKKVTLTVLTIVTLLVAFVTTPVLAAGKKAVATTPYPTTGAAVLPGGLGADAGEITFSVSNGTLTIKVPVSPGQVSEGKLQSADWTISASVSYTDGKKWTLIGSENHELVTAKAENGVITATFRLPAQGNGYFWPRVWGQAKSAPGAPWLFINQSSVYCRMDKKGNPGYEAIVGTNGEVRPVPKTLDNRL
jgi:hypothetical protein